MPKKAKTYKGKSLAPGGGGHFLMVVDALMKQGMSEEQAQAIAAKQGREKYGEEKFNKMAQAGRKRAKKRGK